MKKASLYLYLTFFYVIAVYAMYMIVDTPLLSSIVAVTLIFASLLIEQGAASKEKEHLQTQINALNERIDTLTTAFDSLASEINSEKHNSKDKSGGNILWDKVIKR